jgi:hypothetical protein
MDLETAHVRADDWQLFLNLRGDARLAKPTPTPRTRGRQGDIDDFVDGGRGHTVRVTTVPAPGAPTAPARPGGRRALGKRRSLTFSGSPRGLQSFGQALDLSAEPIAFALQPRVLLPQVLGLLLTALDVVAQTVALASKLLDPCFAIAIRALSHAPVMPESPRRYKSDPLTSYPGCWSA